jgi:PAS domain S-box-containing protein
MDTSTFFDFFFTRAKQNAVLIMDEKGVILKVNKAFTNAFGYTNEEIAEKNFRILFIDEDKKLNRPEMELETVKNEGSTNDENYVVHKDGVPIWSTGESIWIQLEDEHYIMKVIHNIHAQKQLERFLIESNEFIESIFESIRDSALIILDSMMRIIKVNTTFSKFFEIENTIKEGSRLSDLHNPFLSSEVVKKEIRKVIVTNDPIKGKQFEIETKSGEKKLITVDSKIIHVEPSPERKLLIVIKEASHEK